MEKENTKLITAVLIAALLVLSVVLASITFNLELVADLVLSWITTTVYSVFLFFLFDNKIVNPVKIVKMPVYVDRPVIKEIIKEVDRPIQIPVENRTIEVVEKPVIVYRDIVRPLVQRLQAKKLDIPKFRYIGSINTKRYHKKTCRLSKLIKKKFKVQNNSQKFFIRKHYKACKSCINF